MKRMIPGTAALAALFLLACTSKPAPEPAAPASETPEPVATAPDAAPIEPAPAPEPEAEPPPEPAESADQLLASEKAAFERARPVFQQHCARCHAKGGKKAKAKTLGHFDMTRYPFGGHHAHEISAEIREVLAIGGGEPTMPMDDPGAVKDSELSLITAWADAYDRAHAAGAHEGGKQGHHTH